MISRRERFFVGREGHRGGPELERGVENDEAEEAAEEEREDNQLSDRETMLSNGVFAAGCIGCERCCAIGCRCDASLRSISCCTNCATRAAVAGSIGGVFLWSIVRVNSRVNVEVVRRQC